MQPQRWRSGVTSDPVSLLRSHHVHQTDGHAPRDVGGPPARLSGHSPPTLPVGYMPCLRTSPTNAAKYITRCETGFSLLHIIAAGIIHDSCCFPGLKFNGHSITPSQHAERSPRCSRGAEAANRRPRRNVSSGACLCRGDRRKQLMTTMATKPAPCSPMP